MKLGPTVSAAVVLVVASASASTARGDPAPEQSTASPEPSPHPPQLVVTPTGPEIAPRPWLYLDDPSLPAPMHALAFSRATFTSDTSPTRPFGANLGRPGAVLEAGAEAGLLPHLSIAASALGGGQQPGIGAVAGLRLAPFEGLWKTTHLVVSGGWLRELGGDRDGAWLRLAIAQDLDRWRLGATVHGEHVFAGGRDPVDLLFMAGASYAVAGPVRAGLEYVGQDLEESLGDESEGGVRQFLGPELAVDLLERRLSIAGGPAFGIGPLSPPLSGRFSMAYEY